MKTRSGKLVVSKAAVNNKHHKSQKTELDPKLDETLDSLYFAFAGLEEEARKVKAHVRKTIMKANRNAGKLTTNSGPHAFHHIRNLARGLKHKCTDCKKIFHNEKLLREHRKGRRCQTEKELVRCAFFEYKGKKHHHTCIICGKTFTTRNKVNHVLLEHLETHAVHHRKNYGVYAVKGKAN